jgi:hypothetical protein
VRSPQALKAEADLGAGQVRCYTVAALARASEDTEKRQLRAYVFVVSGNVGGCVLPNPATGDFEIRDQNGLTRGYLRPDDGIGGFTFERQPGAERPTQRTSNMNWSTKIALALALAASAPAMAQQDDPKRQLLPRDKYDPCQENREENIWKFQRQIEVAGAQRYNSGEQMQALVEYFCRTGKK